MYKIARDHRRDDPDTRYATVIPVANIRRSVQLLPVFGPGTAPRNWSSQNVLDCCHEFYLDPYLDEHTFMLLR